MHVRPEGAIRAASVVFYVTGLLTLLALGPSLVYNLSTGSSVGSLFGPSPDYGDFIGSNWIGQTWGYAGALVFGVILLVLGGAEVVAGYWLSKRSKKGGKLGAILTPPTILLAIGFVLPLWYILPVVWTLLLAIGWEALPPDGQGPG